MAEQLSRERIEEILIDLRNEPPWRKEAQREADFYDGNQLDQATLQRMEELGVPPIVVNLIKPTVDTVIGLEAKTRTDPLVTSDNRASTEGAEALNQKLKEAVRMTRFNRALSDGFGSQVKCGIGWVEVGREADPFRYKYRVRTVHRNEIWADWRAREPDFSDGRFLVRRKFYDADELETFFPKHKHLIRQSMAERPMWEGPDEVDETLARAWGIERTTSLLAEEWRDIERRRLALYEVWYKVFTHAWVLDLPDGRVVEVNRKERRHLEAIATGLLEPRKVRTHRVRVAYYLGPHQMEDEPTPYPHNRFPYVPLVGYREDRSGAFYGLIRAMKSPQEEVNARRSKMLYNLSTRRVIADGDAVDDHKQAAAEVARSDGYIILNKNRQNKQGAFQVDTDAGLNEQQYRLMIEAKGNVQEASGLFQEMMGRSAGSGQSGEAIKSLVEQGTQVLGEIMDNYTEARRSAAEMLMSLITEDLAKLDQVPVEWEDEQGGLREVVLNQPLVDEFGHRYRSNDVLRLRTKVVLDETPTSSSYRQQVLGRMMELTSSLPDQLQAAVIDLVVDASDLPNRKAYLERIRKATGVGGEQDPAAQQAAQQQQALEMKDKELALAEREAKLNETLEKTREVAARVEKIAADTYYTKVRGDKTAGVESAYDAARTKKTYSEIESDAREQERKDIEQGAELYERTRRLSPDPRNGSPQQ